ncbi:MAG: porin [Gammaproteobacteria bacterium]|nr:porin [Gammaproteobacteria bacterium]
MKNARLAKTLGAAFAAGAALALSPLAHASVPLAGNALEAYGTIDLSLDLSDTDSPGDSSNLGLSSNETQLGLKGQHDINPDLSLVWQLEQEYRTDEGGGEFATRNTFAGFHGSRFGTVLLGYHDTPYKTVGTRWDLLGTTVGDSRAILGASAADGDVMNQRARNALLYMNNFQGLEVQAMYATDAQDNDSNNVDDNDNDLFSAAAWYTLGLLNVSLAYEDWSNLQTGADNSDVNGIRIAASHQVTHAGRLGLIFETISADDIPTLDRNVFGVNGSYHAGTYTYAAQVLIADSNDDQGDSGAFRLGLGVTRQLDAQTRIYAAFGMTDNETNAQYRGVDGGHGDKVPTTPGDTPSAFSAGFSFTF